jgi:hypothetical protein
VPNFSVSRYHCSFLLTAEGVWVIDLLSREGTYVNGQRVKWACLRDGDRVELGKVLVLPRYVGVAPQGPAAFSPAVNGDRFYSTPPASDPDLSPIQNAPASEDTGTGDNLMEGTLVAMPSASQPAVVPQLDMRALEASGPQGALLVPVLQQFGLMQQQMMDQFQQSMQMVVQVFASMHRDQMGMLQQELDNIQRITRELNELQAEARANRQRGAAPYPNGSHTRPFPAPTAERTPPAHPASPQSAPRQPGSTATPPAGGAEPATPPAPPGAMPDMGDMHDWVNQRIHTLQKEREGRWQKILGFVLGK